MFASTCALENPKIANLKDKRILIRNQREIFTFHFNVINITLTLDLYK
jgi:hypothetical protein